MDIGDKVKIISKIDRRLTDRTGELVEKEGKAYYVRLDTPIVVGNAPAKLSIVGPFTHSSLRII